MQTDARKQPPIQHGFDEAGKEISTDRPAYLAISIFALILIAPVAFSGCHWDGRDIVTVSTTDDYLATVNDAMPTLTAHQQAGKAALDHMVLQQPAAGKKQAGENVKGLTQ